MRPLKPKGLKGPPPRGAAVAVTGVAVAGGVVTGALTTTDVEVVVDVTTGAVLGVVVVG